MNKNRESRSTIPACAAKRSGAAGRRCAIYTRKSTDEGLEQEFNSLDAQREAGEAFVESQRHEGWVCLPDRYDDGGFSGGNMDRPALKRLLTDVEAGKIECIVVYKVDRLSRSLLDFARIMETFEKHGVSFVSVTQQFNTNTSMGRLMLNVLLSFAQFEREIMGERTRDKIARSSRKRKYKAVTIAKRVGRLLERNSRGAGLFETDVIEDAEGRAKLVWKKVKSWRDWAALSEGSYLLRSELTDWSAQDLWRAYIQLTEAEVAFRIHKTDLRGRPSGAIGKIVCWRTYWSALWPTSCGRRWGSYAGGRDRDWSCLGAPKRLRCSENFRRSTLAQQRLTTTTAELRLAGPSISNPPQHSLPVVRT